MTIPEELYPEIHSAKQYKHRESKRSSCVYVFVVNAYVHTDVLYSRKFSCKVTYRVKFRRISNLVVYLMQLYVPVAIIAHVHMTRVELRPPLLGPYTPYTLYVKPYGI